MLPIIISYSLGFNHIFTIATYIFFIIAGVTRLAYYNVNCDNDKNNFTGLPITTSTIAIPLIYLLIRNEIAFIITFTLLGLFFIFPIKIKKINMMTKIIFAIAGLIGITFFIIRGVSI